MDLPVDITELVIDFVYTSPVNNYKKCMYELLHHLWRSAEFCGEWDPMRPSEYKTFICGLKNEDEREECPMGAYTWVTYANLFSCNPEAKRYSFFSLENHYHSR